MEHLCGSHIMPIFTVLLYGQNTMNTVLTNVQVQWSLYFKTTHETKKMWSCIAGGLKIKVI